MVHTGSHTHLDDTAYPPWMSPPRTIPLAVVIQLDQPAAAHRLHTSVLSTLFLCSHPVKYNLIIVVYFSLTAADDYGQATNCGHDLLLFHAFNSTNKMCSFSPISRNWVQSLSPME